MSGKGGSGVNGFVSSADACIAHLLYFATIAGWDWCGNGGRVPHPFKARLVSIVGANARSSGIASIESPGHEYDGWSVQFRLRQAGEYDFVHRPGACMIWLSPGLSDADHPERVHVPQQIIGWVESVTCTTCAKRE